MTLGPYHLFSIGLLLILSYLISLLSVRLQLHSSANHRKIWNTVLLLFFLSTALLGFLLAVKVNYKLEITWIESAFQWHVDLGIGFAFVSFFHLSWHLGYFKKILFRPPIRSDQAKLTPHLALTFLQVKLLFAMLGSISIMAQLVLLREFIKTFHGNELVIGIFLASWMILTAAGAWAGSGYKAQISQTSVLKIVLTLGGSPLVVYMLLILLNRYIFLPGYEPGMIVSITYMVLLIGLFTLVSGFLFAYISRAVKSSRIDATYYMLDSLGSLVGGIVFGLILVFFFDNIQVLAFLLFISIVAVILIYGHPAKLIIRILFLLMGGLIFTILLFPENRNTLEGLRYKSESILVTKDTPYGNLTFTEKEGQITGYLDRNPILSSSDLARAEEIVHYPALQHPSPKSFLLLGGGLSGNASEVLKYKPEIFDYCEADPAIYRIGSQHLPSFHKGNLNFIPEDGRSWLLKEDDVKYDVIISAAADPMTIGWNRYFTMEFYQLVKEHLSKEGIFCMQLTTGGNYVNDPGSKVLSINYHTLTQIFDHVTIVPGFATYFLASEKSLSLDFPALLQEHRIQTTYVHPDYLDVTHLTFDAEQLLERIKLEPSGINSDLRPRLFFANLTSLESRMGSHSMVVTGILSFLIFFVLLFSYGPQKTGMYVTGFTGAGIQILLIIVLQSLYGFAYIVAPVMITIFMAGIVAGTLLWRPVLKTPTVPKFAGLLWMMAIVAALGVILLKTDQLYNHRLFGQLIIGLLNLIPGMIVGSVYGVSLELSVERGSSGIGRLYSADLAGAALGTFIPVVFILPLIGVTNTFILFCGINVATGLYILTRWR
ncbi:MAG: fused MFS/spermidine synthase [Bacteroidota bacterium]